MGEPKNRWLIVTPTGDQIVFRSRAELQEAFAAGEGEEDDGSEEPMRVSACDLEPSEAFAAAQRHVVAGRHAAASAAVSRETTLAGIPLPGHITAAAMEGRTTNVGGFAPHPAGAAAASATALLRQTPVPASGPRGRRRFLRTTPAGMFAPPANRLPAAAANDALAAPRVAIGPSGTVRGLVPALSTRTSPGLPPAPKALAVAPADMRRPPRLSSVSPTCPGLYPLATRTSPGLHPSPGSRVAGAVVEMAKRYQAAPAEPIAASPPVVVAPPPPATKQASPTQPSPPMQVPPVQSVRPARATPSPSAEPSLDSVDAIWAAMLQSTSKFVPFPMGRPARMAARTAEPSVSEARKVDEQWPSVADIPALSKVPELPPIAAVVPSVAAVAPNAAAARVVAEPPNPFMSEASANPFMRANERDVLEAYQGSPVVANWAPPPLPPQYADPPPPHPDPMPPVAYVLPEIPPYAGYDIPGPDGFDAAGGLDAQGALPLPPPSLPVRVRSHEGPDLSEAMREQVPEEGIGEAPPPLEAPRYSIPSLDDRDTPSSASMQLMQPERRFPRWWFPLIAAAGFGVGVLIVVGREPPASHRAEAPAKAAVSAPEPKAPAPSAPAASAPAPSVATPPASVNEPRPEPPVVGTSSSEARAEAPTVGTSASERRAEPPTTSAPAHDHATDKTDKGAGRSNSERSAEPPPPKGERPSSAEGSTDGAGEPPATPTKLEGKTSYERALSAQRAGDLARARTLFRQVSEKEPHNFEAQTGLGDAERAQGDKAAAILAYRRALAENPAFYPALLGLADVLWDSGEHAGATERYAEIARRFSPAMYPNRVRERVTETETP